MPGAGHVHVTWIGGPYDGSDMELPELYRFGQFIDLPDPGLAARSAQDEPAIYTPPSHRYRLEPAADGRLTARHVTG